MKAKDLMKKQEKLVRKDLFTRDNSELIEFAGYQFKKLTERRLQIPVMTFSL